MIDPATSSTIYFAPYSGFRYVAVEFSIANPGTSSVTSDPTVDTTLIGSNGQRYSGIYDSVIDCTNLAYTSYDMASLSTRTGCVLFELPISVEVTSVVYSLSFGVVDEAQWSLTPS